MSIIIPFHNSQNNSARLLRTLADLPNGSVEVICVDDGSTDGTRDVLTNFAEVCTVPVKILWQENAGPGRARNNGLRHARGDYVWFVDCDDDITAEALAYFDRLKHDGLDFIDFDMADGVSGPVTNTMGITAGTYGVSSEIRSGLVRTYGSLVTKITRRELLIANELWYPEYCFFEDNLLTLVLPFFVTRFHKADLVGYTHHQEFQSITRRALSPRYFDRLHTAVWGFAAARRLAMGPSEVEAVENRFIDLFFGKTTCQIFGMNYPNTGFLDSLRRLRLAEATGRLIAHFASLWYARSWLVSARVHRYYRELAQEFDLPKNPLPRAMALPEGRRVPWRAIWVSTIFLRGQRRYFERLRAAAWGHAASGSEAWRIPIMRVDSMSQGATSLSAPSAVP
nr:MULTISPECIES: glycosyltransferase family 2 protein [unclassified Cryobacterium]